MAGWKGGKPMMPDEKVSEVWHQSPSRHWFGARLIEEEQPPGCHVCDYRRSHERADSAREAMKLFCAWWFCELLVAGASAAPDTEDRSLALGVACRLGVLRIVGKVGEPMSEEVKLMDVIDAAAKRHAATPSWTWSSEARDELQVPNVDGPRQVALFRLRRLEAEASAAGETAVADELAAILEREAVREEPREA